MDPKTAKILKMKAEAEQGVTAWEREHADDELRMIPMHVALNEYIVGFCNRYLESLETI